MNTASPDSTAGSSHKRHHSPDSFASPASSTANLSSSQQQQSYPSLTSISAAASVFRNVSACNRCRSRKNRCDQNLPACASCEKAKVACVGYDPITKKEIPRSYVYYLETRVAYLERLCNDHGVSYTGADDLTMSSFPGSNIGRPTEAKLAVPHGRERGHSRTTSEKLDSLVSNIGMVSVQGTSDPRFLGSTSGISFARVVLTAIQHSVAGNLSDRRSSKSSGGASNQGAASMRDSFFGLHRKPTIKEAPFPDREIGLRLVELYFEHANPQIPILHRGEFMQIAHRVYASDERDRTARELYLMNIVFAIGSGIFLNGTGNSDDQEWSKTSREPFSPTTKRMRLASHQSEPEEYHASAIVHLESFLSSTPMVGKDAFIGNLEELQAVLLLAGFALLRPVAPGLWYIVGVAVRLALDLGLHYEDGAGLEATNHDQVSLGVKASSFVATDGRSVDFGERGRREWLRDYRRRLWWCTYSFDRLVSSCVGRPFGINDDIITTEFPSALSDEFITTRGFSADPEAQFKASPKLVAYHYFRLRLLQSEILQVLQHESARQIRVTGGNGRNLYIHNKLLSPFLAKHANFFAWRTDIDQRLQDWFNSAPTKSQTGVAFNLEFLELNYWQAVILLYRQSIKIPAALGGEGGTAQDSTVHRITTNSPPDPAEQDRVFLRVAEAGQKILRLYRLLHRRHLVSYTFLATHHLFMAGISFLYAIWHSPAVRSTLTMDEVDNTVLAATSVLTDLIEKCPPAEACRDAFEKMGRATVQMFANSLGKPIPVMSVPAGSKPSRTHRFDMDLTDLFPRQASNSSRQDNNLFRDFNATNTASSGNGLSGMFKSPQANVPNPQFDFEFDLSTLTQWPIVNPGYYNLLSEPSGLQSGQGEGMDMEGDDMRVQGGDNDLAVDSAGGNDWDPMANLFNPLGGYFFGNSDEFLR